MDVHEIAAPQHIPREELLGIVKRLDQVHADVLGAAKLQSRIGSVRNI
jgi:hypothetical protein